MDNVFKAVKDRRSIRKYSEKEVEKEKLQKVLEAGNWAPSNGNSQPWNFIITKGEYVNKICNVFYNWAKDYIPNAPYIPAEKKPGMLEYAKNFGGAPNHIIVTYETYDDDIKTEESLMAACAAIQNIALKAWEEGLGTVWIAGHVTHDNETRSILSISDNEMIAGIIPIGYPDMNPPAPPRVDPELKDKARWLGF